MYKEHQEFLAWASQYDRGLLDKRSAQLHKQWLANISCPILKIDDTVPVGETLALLAQT